MSVDLVMDTTIKTLATVLAPATPLQGISDGEPESIPSSPWAWIEISSFDAPEMQGPDFEQTNWTLVLHIVSEWQNDPLMAAKVLRSLVEPIRQVFRAHIKQGQPSIVLSRVTGGNSGYMEINGVWYKLLDLNILVKEKEVKVYNA